MRTPLTVINGYLDLLDREEKSEAAMRYLARIRNRTEELFRYSVAASAGDLAEEDTDLKAVLEESLVSFYGVMRERGMTPEISLPERPVRREFNKEALGRVFSNILSNALKYSDGDFSVTLTEEGDMTFSNRAAGLDAVAVGRLFDRFYTVESVRPSAGLGLSIARNLTERMKISIGAEYKEGRLNIRLIFEKKG